MLHLSTDLENEGCELIKYFDTGLDWSNPGGPSKWSNREREAFYERSKASYASLVDELGEEYEVVNEVGA